MRGMSVKPLRHAVDRISKRAAEQHHEGLRVSNTDQGVREAMAMLSAHSEETSDQKYGNDADTMVFNLSGLAMDKFRLCAKLFNDMMGITLPQITRESTPSRREAGSVPTKSTPQTKGRRVQNTLSPSALVSPSRSTSILRSTPLDCLSQTTSGFQWPPSRSLFAIDEHASSVSDQDQIDLLWSELSEGIDDVPHLLTAGRKRAADKCL